MNISINTVNLDLNQTNLYFRDLSVEESSRVYFLSIVDVLTYYGMKKVAAKAAKTVKYGSGVDGNIYNTHF